MENRHRITFTVPKAMKDNLRKLATKEKRSISYIIVDLLYKPLEKRLFSKKK